MRKLLLLGGKPIGACEIVNRARELGLYTIVADYLSPEQSFAKRLADESWQVSTADLDLLEDKARNANVDGVIAGVHEFNIEMAIRLAERLGLPPMCTLQQWNICNNKARFKELCQEFHIPVSKQYDYSYRDSIEYPVICKPTDGSGSRGFSICHNEEELENGYRHALNFSESKCVLIEKYMPFDSVITHYTFLNGTPYFSGMSDKKSQVLNGGGSIMALQTFPAANTSHYLARLDAKLQAMFKYLGIIDGVLWVEAFDNAGDFTINEMGLRLGGSLTCYPVKYYTGIEQLDLLIRKTLGETLPPPSVPQLKRGKYAILPLHVKSGKIKKITGIEKIKRSAGIYAYVPVHFEGDEIQNWNSAQQVFCYLHILYDSPGDLQTTARQVLNDLRVEDENGAELLFSLYNSDKLA